MLKWPNKDPDEVLDYGFLWADRLDGDQILTSTWIVPDGITKDDDGHGDDVATIWLSGGTLEAKYTLTNRITTAGGRTMDQSAVIQIKAK